MAKKEQEVLDKKTLEKFRKEIKEDFDNNYRETIVKELADEISNEAHNKFNREYKDQIIEEVTVDVKDEIKNQIYKEEKKLGAAKSFKIFRLSIYLLVLLAIIGYVGYRLYITDNVDLVRYDYQPTKSTQSTNNGTNNNEQKNQEEQKPQIDYKALYGHLLSDLKIYDYSLYRDFHKVDELTNVQKIQMAYSTISDADMEIDGSIITIKSSVLRDAYIRLFGTDDYKAETFSIYNLTFVYSSAKNEYIGIVYSENVEDVSYEVFDAGIENDVIYVKAYAARLQNGKVYNIKNGRAVGTVSDKLSEYGNKLSIITVRFNKEENFLSISNE